MVEKPTYEELEKRVRELEKAESEHKQAREVLQESEDRYRTLAENTDVGMTIIGTDYTIQWVNTVVGKWFDKDPSEFVGKYCYEEFEKSDSICHYCPAVEAIATGKPNETETQGMKPDGSTFTVRDRVFPIIKDGKVIAFNEIIEDITEQKKLEVELEEHRNNLEKLVEIRTADLQTEITEHKQAEEALKESKIFLDNMSDLAYMVDDQGNILWVNTVAERMTGLPHEQIINKPFLPMFIDEDHASLVGVYQRTLNGEALENTFTFKTGITCHFTSLPKRDNHGNIIGIFGIARDITERVHMEQALKDSEQMYRTTFETIPDSITITCQKDGRYRYVNDGFCKITCYSRNEVIGKTPFDINLYVNTSDRESMVQSLQQQGELLNFEIPFRKKDGTIWDSFFSARPIVVDGENCLIALTKDVTELKRAEKERVKLETQLRQAQKMESIGTLAGGIAHDFNNILSSILGFTELAIDDVEKDTTIRDNLQEVYTAGKRARELVKQILAFARQSDAQIKPIQLGVVAKEVLDFIRSSIPTTIEIKKNISNDSLIMGNSTQVYQILMNLCTNAAYAMEDKGGVLDVSLTDIVVDGTSNRKKTDVKFGDYVEIKVSDTGSGIAPETIKSIFEPYFTTKGPGEGTGMGLAMVYGIVESYGGEITVDSALGKGTTFSIFLPVTSKRKENVQYEPEELPTGTEHILFVDDEAAIAKMGSQGLERLGYKVTVRTSSIEALELFRVKPDDFDLIITDMTMPNMTGDKLAVEIMQIRPDIPVILCTGYSKKISIETASEIGIKAFAMKPLDKSDLAKTVRKVLDEAKGETQQ